MNLQEAIDRYLLETYLPRQPKYRTLMKAKGELALICRQLGDPRIESINTRDIADWRYRMLKQGLAGATINRRQNDLRAVLRKVKRWGYEIPEVEFDRVRTPQPQERYLSDEEYRRLIPCCPPATRRLVIFLANTGARRSEATDLSWDDVDLDAGHVRFRRTKSGKARCVPLTKEAKELLASMDRTKPHLFRHSRRVWERARRRAGLPRLRLHDLRHYLRCPAGSQGCLPLRGPEAPRARYTSHDAPICLSQGGRPGPACGGLGQLTQECPVLDL